MRFVCHRCKKLVHEGKVIIDFRDGFGFAGGDARAYCSEECWKNLSKR